MAAASGCDSLRLSTRTIVHGHTVVLGCANTTQGEPRVSSGSNEQAVHCLCFHRHALDRARAARRRRRRAQPAIELVSLTWQEVRQLTALLRTRLAVLYVCIPMAGANGLSVVPCARVKYDLTPR